MQLTIKEKYDILNRSITIYIEYVEQSIKNEFEYNSATLDVGKIITFIHKKAFDDQLSVALTKIAEVDVSRIIKITNTILLWNNEIFTLENRLSICNQFLQSYILLFNNDSLIYYVNALEFILEKINETDFEGYISFLTEFYLFVSRRKSQQITESAINNMFLNKYYSQMEEFDNMVFIRKKEKNSKAFIRWFFS
jgi:hypothetical protein